VVAFVGEGPTDERFLTPVIRRLMHRQLEGETSATVQILPIIPADRAVGTLRTVLSQRRQEFDLLILHTDGRGDPDRARRERVAPVRDALALLPVVPPVAAAIPVHETEAWALADGDALREAFGTTASDQDLGLAAVGEIERLAEPKEHLQQILVQVRGRRRPVSPVPLERIAELVALDRLHRLAAFRAFETDLAEALRALRLVGARRDR
jgi:hypothetical protein